MVSGKILGQGSRGLFKCISISTESEESHSRRRKFGSLNESTRTTLNLKHRYKIYLGLELVSTVLFINRN